MIIVIVNTYFMIRTVVITASTIIAVSITNSATRAAEKAVMIIVVWSDVAAGDNQVYKVNEPLVAIYRQIVFYF